MIQNSVFGQVIVQRDSYYDVKFGTYETKSVDIKLTSLRINASIKPQTIVKNAENTAFLYVDKAIVLFNTMNEKGLFGTVGLLRETSAIQLDTIFYNEIFKDTTKNSSLTFNVWYAITINGKQYYTDYKIHDFVALRKKMDKYDQELLLIAQNTGYDIYYDKGYPNQFFAITLNSDNEIIYKSDILKFNYGDEFWDHELMNHVSGYMTKKGFELTLFGIEDYKGIWTGEELIDWGN